MKTKILGAVLGLSSNEPFIGLRSRAAGDSEHAISSSVEVSRLS